jgi:acetoin utilization deacetylase AcuC-like enzyme
MTVCIISHPDCHLHTMPNVAGDEHPENSARIDAISNQLVSSGLDYVLMHREGPEVTREQLERVHDSDYLDALVAKVPLDGFVEIGEDAFLSPCTLKAASRAAGSVVLGVDIVMQRLTKAVFANVRPPGHHAEHKRAMGFCFFNNIAVGAAYALAEYDLQRVAIVDFDVHHGNGTENVFADDARVLFCSSFQDRLFPQTEIKSNRANFVATPLSAVTKGAQFRQAITDQWLPALEVFNPQLIFISAGFDAHLLDDMSQVSLTEVDYQWVTEQLRSYMDSKDDCLGIVSGLEGGYDSGALARSAVAHIKALGKL